jgi:hypothetical protein
VLSEDDRWRAKYVTAAATTRPTTTTAVHRFQALFAATGATGCGAGCCCFLLLAISATLENRKSADFKSVRLPKGDST